MQWAGPGGILSMYVSGAGPPMLLIHSVNAAASAAEVRPLENYYAQRRQVFCIDLPGYGFSTRDDLPYSPRLMTDAVCSAVAQIERITGVAQVDALALSLSSEFLARAAAERASAFKTVALVSPTGFQKGAKRRGEPGSTLGQRWLYAALQGPGWGKGLFELLTRPKVIRYFLRRTWGSKIVDDELWHYDIATARQPGAHHAPLRFLSGFLFSRDIHFIYERLLQPVWMCHGVRGDFTDYGNVTLVENRPNWTITTYQTGALPLFEIPEQFCRDYDSFLAAHGS